MHSKFLLYPPNSSRKIGFDTIRQAALRKCYTPYGHEWLKKEQPSPDPETVQHRLVLASEWMKLLQSDLSHPLTTVGDLRTPLKESRMIGSMLRLDDFPVVLENARLARILSQFFRRQGEEYPALQEIASRLINLKPLEEAIQNVITDRGELRDDASKKLKSIRGKLNRERNRLRDTIRRVMNRAVRDGMASDEGPTIRNGRMVIPIQVEYKRKVEGFIHDVSSSGQTVYLEPAEALQINNDIRQLEAEEKQEIESIIRELTARVQQYHSELLANSKQFAQFDAIHSKVSLGLDLEGSVPVLTPAKALHLIQARNPVLLLKKLTEKELQPIVPLDLELHPEELALVITGPNAGGKSVALKTVGLLSMMVQCGYPVPVQPDSTLPVLSGLFVDIGDDQSIENDLSTFSSRLQWMRQTMEQLRTGSLVLIDEAGAGTDPEEGGALFQAFVEEVIDAGARVLITTHHGSLKVFAYQHSRVVNGAMEFNQENLSPTYRFRKGIPGSSYAFEIADRMELPATLMKRARSVLGEKQNSMGDLLVNLEKRVQETESLYQETSAKHQELERREKRHLDQVQNFEKKRKRILQKAYKDAGEIMKSANRRIEEAVEKVVHEGHDDKKKIKEARHDLLEAKKEIHLNREALEKEIEEKPRRSDEKPALGDYVLVGDSNTSGELVEISGNKATVFINGMKIKADLNKLVKTRPPEQKKKKYSVRTYSGASEIDLSVKPSLDLRGYRGEEAIKELTLYLDKAVARGLNHVEIIHGKGEGILLKLVHELLEAREEVRSFDIAPMESGGSGCTIVQFES